MTDKLFVDTNILIYALDRNADAKHQQAAELIRQLWENGGGVLSTQVLQEFYVNVTQKIQKLRLSPLLAIGDSSMSEYPVTGSCLCKNVAYEISGNLGIFQYCNCSRCRKFTGSAFASNLLVSPSEFRWLKGENFVARFELAEAKHFATAFCRKCGSSLPWLTQTGTAVVIPAGTLDGDPQIRPFQNIFCASRAVWYTEPGSLPEYDELPPKKR